MVRRLVLIVAVLAIIGLAAFWVLTMPRTLSAAELPDHQPDVANGEYVFNAAGCAACHADPALSDTSTAKELPGGLKLASPFGTFYAPNISPDPEHGIGKWTTLDLVNALKFGVAPDGTHLYPAFPYTSYQRMTLEDIIDLKAYLDTLPPVANDAPPHALPFPFGIRRGIGLWQLLYVDGKAFEANPQATAEINRGAYLVQAQAHCGECHTPRNLIGGPDQGRMLAGGPSPEGKGGIPNITPDAEHGIGKMGLEDFTFNLIMFGQNHEGKNVGSGGMSKVLHELNRMTPEDQQAIYAYLRTVPPIAEDAPKVAKEEGAAAQ